MGGTLFAILQKQKLQEQATGQTLLVATTQRLLDLLNGYSTYLGSSTFGRVQGAVVTPRSSQQLQKQTNLREGSAFTLHVHKDSLHAHYPVSFFFFGTCVQILTSADR